MTLYTTRAVAAWLGLTEKRIRQLKEEGIIEEVRPGLYDMQPTVKKYCNYLRTAGAENLKAEQAKLAKAKREAKEMENEVLRGNLHRTEDVERGLKTILFNIRSQFLALPSRLAPLIAQLNGDNASVYDTLHTAITETLEALSQADVSLRENEDDSATN